MLNQALHYLRLGYSVIPLCSPRDSGTKCSRWGETDAHKPGHKVGKTALVRWTEFQQRLPSEKELTNWLNTWPDANLGAITGPLSNLAVIDSDGPEGQESLTKLGLTSSLVLFTGNGKHLLFQWPINGVSNSVKTLAPGLDVRGEDGIIVLPPSIHPNGKRYRFNRPVLSAEKLPPFPVTIFASAVETNQGPAGAKNEQGWISKALEEMKIGNIDESLFRICSRLRNDGYSKDDARALLYLPAKNAGAVEGHLDDKIENVWGRYAPKRVGAPIPHTGTLVLHSPTNPDSLHEYSKRISADGSNDNLKTGYARFDEVTKGLKKGEVLTVAARTGVGKTNWVITPIRTFCEAGKSVLLFSTEMSFDQIWQRYRATLTRETEFAMQKFFICDEFTPDIERIEEAIKNVTPDLFIFDHISHIGTDYHIISKFMSEIKRLARLFNIPAIVTAQLNRNADYVDQGARVEPRLSMIQGSDQIGQMSAQVLLLNEKRIVDGETEIEGIVVKNRHGDRGMVQFVLKSKPFYRMEETQ